MFDGQIQKSGEFQQQDFSVDFNKELFRALSDTVYSDKVLAPMREYSTNAYDAQVEAGTQDKPFDVTLPTSFDPYFAVRDYGTGLSHEDMQGVFTSYGTSTKRDSDTVIGKFGLGCKSGFAYADSFIVTSYHNGVKRVYTAYRNAIEYDDKGKVIGGGTPTLALTYEANTDEENGLEVRLAVNTEDVTRFVERAKSLYIHFDPIPHFINYPSLTDEIKAQKGKSILSGNGWRLLPGGTHSSAQALVGLISYPIDVTQFSKADTDVRRMLSAPLEIKFNVRDLEMSISRESLSYTPATVAAIVARCNEIREEVQETISKEFEGCKSEYMARVIYKSIAAKFPSLAQNFATFKNKSIQSSVFQFPLRPMPNNTQDKTGCPRHVKILGATVPGYQIRSRHSQFRMNYATHDKMGINVYDDQIILVVNSGRGWQRNLYHAVMVSKTLQTANDIVVLMPPLGEKGFTKEALRHIFRHFAGGNIIFSSNIPDAPRAVGSGSSRSQISRVYTRRNDVTGDNYSQNYLTDATVDLAKGTHYYIHLNNWLPVLYDAKCDKIASSIGWSKVNSIISGAKALGISYPNPIFIPGTHKRSVLNKDNCVSWFDHMQTKFDKAECLEAVKKVDQHQTNGELRYGGGYSYAGERLRNFIKRFPDHQLVKDLGISKPARVSVTDRDRALREVGCSLWPMSAREKQAEGNTEVVVDSGKVEAFNRTINTKYPLLQVILQHHNSSVLDSHILEYIDTMDMRREKGVF